MTQRRQWEMAAGIAAFAVLWLAGWSQADWLIRAQATAAAGGRLVGWVDDQTTQGRQNERAREAQIAREKPDDYHLQMAIALRNVPIDAPPKPNETLLRLDELSGQKGRVGQATADRLRGLLPRFREYPALHATILRYLSLESVRLPDRREADLLSAEPRLIPPAPLRQEVNSPQDLQAWEDACLAGEKLDPQNAFLPTMRAAGLFAQKREAEAEAVLLQAGKLSSFNDYANDETRAMWQLMEKKNNGEPGAVPRLAQAAALTFPHYTILRQLARIATVRAMQAEIQGDAEKGFKLRHAVGHIGAAMRASGRGSIIGTMVGEAVTEISYLRPCGIPTAPSGNGWHETIQTTYRAYLEHTGHADEARFVLHENDARKQVGAIMRAAQTRPEYGGILPTYGRLTAAWAVGIALLSNALVVLVAGGLAAFYCRFFGPSISATGSPYRILWGTSVLLLSGAGLFALGRHGGTLAAAGLGCGLIGAYENHQNETEHIFGAFAVGAASVAGVLGPLVFGLAIKSRRARVSLGDGVAHGLVRLALPITVALLLAYAGVTVWTLHEEARLTQSQKRTVQGGGPFFAELTGKPWPGLLEETKGSEK